MANNPESVRLAKKKQEELRQRNKPKSGQKGAGSSVKSSATKAEAVGGYTKPAPKPAAKPAAKPASKTKVADYQDAQGNTYDGNTGRLKSKVAAKPAAKPPAPKPSPQPAPKPAAKPAAKPADKVPASNAGMKNQNKDYRGNLFERTFGYKRGEAPDQVAKRNELAKAQSDANKAQIKQGPPQPASPAQPAAPPSPNQPKKEIKTQVMTLAERMRRRRMGLD